VKNVISKKCYNYFMKNFIDVENNKQIDFTVNDLPMVVHGREHSGSSLFAITMAVHLHSQGNKILMFTAYPMAMEEFISQVGEDASVFYLEYPAQIYEAQSYQTVIVRSGDMNLCAFALSNLPDIHTRIAFIKNVESILTEEIASLLNVNERTLISGDIDSSTAKEFIKNVKYQTKVFFSDSNILPKELPTLKKYQACVIKEINRFIVSLI
jgi:hypothetical protein